MYTLGKPERPADTERAVSDLVAKGLTNQQIAGEMFLSTHTVAFHLRQVFRKLDIRTRSDLVRWMAATQGTDPIPDTPAREDL